MIKHKIFTKGEYVQALISTTQNPNVLIPVRGLIYDVKFDDVNPRYQIRIKKFYDNIVFLKAYSDIQKGASFATASFHISSP